jgi:hypothetical protein
MRAALDCGSDSTRGVEGGGGRVESFLNAFVGGGGVSGGGG